MNALVPIALFGWIPLVIGAALALPPRRVILLAYIVGWMFLPVATFEVQGFLNFDKTTATNLAALLVVIFFDPRQLVGARPRDDRAGRFEWASVSNVAAASVVMLAGALKRLVTRVRWFDVPALIWCVCPIFSSLANELGFYDGFAHAVGNTITWGIPYLIGRVYFSDAEGLRELALGIVFGGLVYVPLCLWEIRMSPLLHDWVYGFHQHLFSQSFRGGMYRPTVFMRHGLMVGMWMSTACLMSLHSRQMGRKQGLFGLPVWVETSALVVTLVLCQSWAATAFFFIGAAVRFTSAHSRKAWTVAALLCIPVVYVSLRAGNTWTGDSLVSSVRQLSDDRAESIAFRFESEKVLAARALEQPVFGWGGWGRNFAPRDEEGELMAVADGTWIRVFGEYGFVGLVALFGLLILPVGRFIARFRPRTWRDPALAAAATLSISLALYSIDSLVNDMINPIFVLIAGGLNALVVMSEARAPAAACAAQVAVHAAS